MAAPKYRRGRPRLSVRPLYSAEQRAAAATHLPQLHAALNAVPSRILDHDCETDKPRPR